MSPEARAEAIKSLRETNGSPLAAEARRSAAKIAGADATTATRAFLDRETVDCEPDVRTPAITTIRWTAHG